MADAPSSSAPLNSHNRKGSIGLSPVWSEHVGDTGKGKMTRHASDEAIASPRVTGRGIVDVDLQEIAFFPLLPAAAAAVPRNIGRVERNEEEDVPPIIDIEGVRNVLEKQATMTDDTVAAQAPDSENSDHSVVSSSDSKYSEFSENTAGSRFAAVAFLGYCLLYYLFAFGRYSVLLKKWI